MLAFYWFLGPNIAFSIGDLASIWGNKNRNDIGEYLSENKILWVLISLSGLMFIPEGSPPRYYIMGVVQSLVAAVAFRYYLIRLLAYRKKDDYVKSQKVAFTAAVTRLVLVGIILIIYTVLNTKGLINKYTSVYLLFTLNLGIYFAHFFAAKIVGSVTDEGIKRIEKYDSAFLGMLPIMLVLTFSVLLSRSIISGASYLLDESLRPALTILSGVILFGGRIILNLALDISNKKRYIKAKFISAGLIIFLLIISILTIYLKDFDKLNLLNLSLISGFIVTLVNYYIVMNNRWYRDRFMLFALLFINITAYFILIYPWKTLTHELFSVVCILIMLGVLGLVITHRKKT